MDANRNSTFLGHRQCGAPVRMKLGTAMLLSALYNFFVLFTAEDTLT